MNGFRLIARLLASAIFCSAAHAESEAKFTKRIPAVLGESGCSVFLKIVEAAGMTAKLEEKGPLTCIAPTDRAFESLPETRLEELLDPARRSAAAKWVSSLVIETDVNEDVLLRARRIPTLSGRWVEVWVSKGVIRIDNVAELSRKDLKASNGVVHLTDHFPSWASARDEKPEGK